MLAQPNLFKRLLLLAVLAMPAILFVLLKTQPAEAANPSIIPFQGKVVNADGTNVTNGAYNFDFVLYDDPSLGSPSDGVHDKWHELTKSVTVTNGVFQTNLGSATALPDFNANPSLYLAVRFNADAAGYMTPRIQMGSVPYALNSDALGGISKTGFVQIGPTTVQADASTNSSIFLNKTGVSGNIVQLQKAGADVFVFNSSGQLNLQPAVDGNALQVKTNGGAPLLTVDTSGGNVQVGNTSADATASQFVVDTKNTAGDPTGVNGGIYYNSSSGNLRCYQNNTWSDCLTASGNATTSIVSGRANVAANQTGLSVETLVFTSATGVSNTAGATGFTAPAAGSFRTCLVKNNAAITAGNLDVRWQVNGASVGSAVCHMDATTSRSSGSAIAGGSVTFAQGDTIGIAFDTDAGFLPAGSNDFTVFWTIEYYSTSSNPSGATLQSAYDNNATINMTDGRDFLINAADTTTDPNILLNLQCVTSCGSNGRFAVRSAGTDVLSIQSSGLGLFSNNSTTGFRFQDSANSKYIMTIDSSGDQVVLGQQGASGVNGKLVFNTTNASNTNISIAAASTGASYSLTLPTTGPSTSQCLQTDTVTASQLLFGACGNADNISVNSSAATDANFTDVTATGTVTGTTWTLNTGPNPDTITLGISNASATVAGAVTTGGQTFAGDKTFNGQVGASNLGIEFSESDTNPTCASGNFTIYADNSEGRLKKCQNGVLSDLAQDSDVINKAKSADQSVTNSTTLVDETALQFNLGASEEWNVIWNLMVTNNNNAGPDWKGAVKGPAGVVCRALTSGAEPAGAAFPQATSTNCTTPTTMVNNTIVADGGVPFIINVTANVAGGGTAGTVSFQFAENTGGVGTSITVKEGSVMNAYRVTGADLAEFYNSRSTSLVPGDVVSLDSTLDAGVKKSTSPYQGDLMGVISTKPGVVMGSSSKNSEGVPVMLALAGRVPVKVSTENGPIKAGDLLTSSSVPGVAMRASKPGQTIGIAMNGYGGIGLGMVTVFIKNTYSADTGSQTASNQKLDDSSVLQSLFSVSDNPEVNTSDLSENTIAQNGSQNLNQSSSQTGDRPQAMNAVQQKPLQLNSSLNILGTLSADKIQAREIEGLTDISTRLASLEEQLSSAQNTDAPTQKTQQSALPKIQTNTPKLAELTKINGLDVMGDARFHGNTFFYGLVSFVEKTVFNNDVTFGGHILTDGQKPVVENLAPGITTNIDGNDNSGQLTFSQVAASTTGELAKVSFVIPYDKTPKINLTPANAAAAGVKFYVDSDSSGFKIIIIDGPQNTGVLKFNYLVVQ